LRQDGSLGDIAIDDAVMLIRVAERAGGLSSVFGRAQFSPPEPRGDAIPDVSFHGPTGLADFVLSRREISHTGGDNLAALSALYVKHLTRAEAATNGFTSSLDTIGAINRGTEPALAYFLIVLECLRTESSELTQELKHHAHLPALDIIREGIARRLGVDPTKWSRAIEAYVRRDKGTAVHVGGRATWNGSTERPALDLPSDVVTGARRLPFADHPLLDGVAPSTPPRVGGLGKLGEGFEEASTPLGKISWRYQKNMRTGTTEIVFTGSDPSIAVALQHLTAVNGGTNVPDICRTFLFPFSRALELVRRVWDHMHYEEFANASGFFIRLDPETLMHEVVYTRAREQYVPGIDTPQVGFIRPDQLLAAWHLALKSLAHVTTPIEYVEDSEPTPTAILEAMQRVLREVAPEIAQRLRERLAADTQALFKGNMPAGVWHARTGIIFDPAAGETRVVVRLFADKPAGMWGPTDSLVRASRASELVGRLTDHGLEWEGKTNGVLGAMKGAWRAIVGRSSSKAADDITSLPRIQNAAELPSAPEPAIIVASSHGPLEPYVSPLEKLGPHVLARIPVTPEALEQILAYGGTMGDAELDRVFPDPVGQARRTIAWIEEIKRGCPEPQMLKFFNEWISRIHEADAGYRLKRALEAVIPDALHHDDRDIERARAELRGQVGLSLSDDLSGEEPPRMRAALLDRLRLALAGDAIEPGILTGISHEMTQQAIDVSTKVYSFSPGTVFHMPRTHDAMNAVACCPRLSAVHALFQSRTGVDDPLTFLQFLEFEIGVKFNARKGLSLRQDWLEWVRLRDARLWAVPNKADVLGKRLPEYALVHDSIGILAGALPPHDGTKGLLEKGSGEVDSSPGDESASLQIDDGTEAEGGISDQLQASAQVLCPGLGRVR
ncbi:MAG: hypothetical protein WC956_07185, partial [bacterium]